jgi:uncharacterized protein (DUF58 family)
MNPRLLTISLVVILLILAGLILQKGELLALAIPLVVYLAIAWVAAPESIEVEAKRILSGDRVSQGSPVDVVLRITNVGSRLEEVYIQDLVPSGLELASGESSLLCSLEPDAVVILNYSVSGERGNYRFPGVRVTASERLGLISKRIMLPVVNRLFVLPKVEKLRRLEIRPRFTRIYAGQIPARVGGPGVEFFGVRPYQSGDPMRWINSRASARNPEALFINEFEQERVADVGLILDARLVSNLPDENYSLLDHSIEAVASLSDSLLDKGNRVGMLIYGGPLQWTFPGYGKMQRERILRALASADLGANPIFEDLGYIPTKLFPTRTQLIIISPLINEDLAVLIRLRARGYPLIIVSPDSISYERQRLGDAKEADLACRIAQIERDLLLRKLVQAGVQIVNWDVEKPFHHVAYQVLSRSAVLRASTIGRPN